MKTFTLFLILLPLLALTASASEYPVYGTNGYAQDFGNIALYYDGTTRSGQPIDQPVMAPLVADLDNDGRQEILVIDGVRLRLFQNTTVTPLASKTLNVTNITHVELFDIDSDGQKEIIVSSSGTSREIDILSYNVTIQYEATLPATGSLQSAASESFFNCVEPGNCIYYYTRGVGGTSNEVQARRFNSSGYQGSETNIYTRSGCTAGGGTCPALCTPQIAQAQVADVVPGGQLETVITWMEVRADGGTGDQSEHVRIFWLNSSGTGVTLKSSADLDLGNRWTASVAGGCSNLATARGYGTSPLVADFDPEPGLETVIAGEVSSGGFEMDMYDQNGARLDEWPDDITLNNADGTLISNPFRADALEEDGRRDFCVLGANPAGDEINILCGSVAHSVDCLPGWFIGEWVLGDLCDFTIFDSIEIPFNISGGNRDYHIMAHAAQFEDVDTPGFGVGGDLDEIITSYGIVKLVYEELDSTNELLFTTGVGDAVVYAIDLMGSGLADLIALSNTNLFVINDGYENEPATIRSVTTNPCIQNVLKQNTTVQVTFEVDDQSTTVVDEHDQVSGRIIAYAGEGNEQDSGFTVNSTEGTSFTLWFTANQSTPTSNLQIVGRDTGNPTELDIITRQFTVASSGSSFGESSCTESFDLEDEVVPFTNSSMTPNEENVISNFAFNLNELTGIGTTALWLIVMVILAVGVWIFGHRERMDAHLSFGVIVFVEVLMFVLGAIFGFISVGVIIVLSILAITILALLFGRKLLFGGD